MRLLSGGFSQVMMPNTKNMNLPVSSGCSPGDGGDQVSYFYKVEMTMTVMKSMALPKKVTFRGTDGRRQAFLCKPKDDLRRDCRLADFNDLLNKLFVGDPECRRRELKIRTYVSFLTMQQDGLLSHVKSNPLTESHSSE